MKEYIKKMKEKRRIPAQWVISFVLSNTINYV